MKHVLEDYAKRSVQFLVYSNFYIALAGAGMAVTTLFLAGFPVRVGPIFVAFTIPMFVYNLNRFTDIEEDAVNVPQRSAFVRKYGKILLPTGILLYISGLWISFSQNLATFSLTLAPGTAGVIYSVLRAKKMLMAKNVIVGLSWGTIPLIVGTHFSSLWATEVIFLFVFFTVAWFINTIIFDIKDIEGDREEGVRTAPNTFGVPATKRSTQLVNVFMAAIITGSVIVGSLPQSFFILLLFNVYVALYIYFAKEDWGPLFYGVVVDGECIFLAAAITLIQVLG